MRILEIIAAVIIVLGALTAYACACAAGHADEKDEILRLRDRFEQEAFPPINDKPL